MNKLAIDVNAYSIFLHTNYQSLLSNIEKFGLSHVVPVKAPLLQDFHSQLKFICV